MIAITRRLIYVRLPMPFGALIEVIDQNGVTTTLGDGVADRRLRRRPRTLRR